MTDERISIYDRVTNEIIADLEQGVRPWQKPWSGDSLSRPIRPLRHTGEAYNGVNVLLLWIKAVKHGYQNPTWMTYKQAEEYGAHVRKGEKSSHIVYANKITKTEVDADTGAETEREIPFLRGYSVFNAEQIDDLPEKFLFKPEPPAIINNIERIERFETFFSNTGIEIRNSGAEAYYIESQDRIQMPTIETFIDAESYYATLAHEATHATAHKDRLDRHFEQAEFGKEGYAKEELIAEIGSAFLCADLGITPEVREDHAAYISTWLAALKNDHKLIFTAAAHATRATEFLKAKQPNLTVRPELGQGAIRAEPVVINNDPNAPLYTSPPMQIGQHLWRMKIDRYDDKRLCTSYEFQDESGSFWHRGQEWRGYDINDTYLGLPKGLAKLYERERPVLIKHGLAQPPAPSRQTEFRF